MKKLLLLLALSAIPFLGYSQLPLKFRGNGSGMFSVGARATFSMFNGHSWDTYGLGSGGQFRIQIMDFLNSEYFADIMVSDIGGYAHREDFHIGTSFLFYFLPGNNDWSKPVRPFLETGICFDYTRIIENDNLTNERRHFSAAWPVGAGAHFNLTPRFDVTLKAQYMMHLGSDIDVHQDEQGQVHIEKHPNASLEGHLFVSLTVNYKVIDLWSSKGVLHRLDKK